MATLKTLEEKVNALQAKVNALQAKVADYRKDIAYCTYVVIGNVDIVTMEIDRNTINDRIETLVTA